MFHAEENNRGGGERELEAGNYNSGERGHLRLSELNLKRSRLVPGHEDLAGRSVRGSVVAVAGAAVLEVVVVVVGVLL